MTFDFHLKNITNLKKGISPFPNAKYPQNNNFSALFPSTNTQKAFEKCMGRSNHLQNGSSYYKKLKRSNKPEIRIII